MIQDIKILIVDRDWSKNKEMVDDIFQVLSKCSNLELTHDKRLDGQYHMYVLLDPTQEDVINARKSTPYACIYAISNDKLNECDHIYSKSTFRSNYILRCVDDIRQHRRKFKKVIEKLDTLKKCQQNLSQESGNPGIHTAAIVT